MSHTADIDAPGWHPTVMLSRGNRLLLALLLRRFGQWEPADRRWLIARLRAEHARVIPPGKTDA